MEIHGIDSNVRNTFTGQVISIDETSQKIKEENKYFGINLDSFEANFVDENNNFWWSVNIRNMKEEAKDENVESGISDNDE